MLTALLRNIDHISRHPFSRGRRMAAIGRFLQWQVSSRIALGPTIVDFVDSMKLCVANGMTGATGNIYTGLAEFDDMALVLHALRPDELFVDIGANIGSYTILASAAGARTIAFEPVPATYERLQTNIRLNGLTQRVTAHRAALGRVAGVIRFTASHDTVNHVATDDDRGETVVVPIVTVDEIVAGAGLSPTLIKIDVEGYETEALAGAQATLKLPSLRIVIMELNGSGSRYGFDESALHQNMLDHGFEPYRYDALARELSPLDGKNMAQGNTLYVRDVASLKARVREARPFTVQGRAI